MRRTQSGSGSGSGVGNNRHAGRSSSRRSLEDDVLVTRAPDEETEDGRIRNREAAAKIRDMWLYKQIRLRQREFTHFRQVRTFFFVWLLVLFRSVFLFLFRQLRGSSSIPFRYML